MALTWTLETTPTSGGYTAVCWSPDLALFLAGGSGAVHKFATSPDGVTWTGRDFSQTQNCASLIWSRSLTLFVALSSSSSNQCIMTSPDGIAWTLQAATPYGAASPMRSLAVNATGNLIVAVGNAGQAMYSTNGTVWTASNATPDATSNWMSVTFDATLALFVAVASSGNVPIMTSPDGITWTGRMGFQVAFQKSWSSVTSTGNGQLVAVANYDANVTTLLAMTSSDGITWVIRSTPTFKLNSAKGWNAIAYSSEALLFVAVGDQGTTGTTNQEVMYSADNGTTWTLSDAANNTKGWVSVCWSPQLYTFVAGSNGGEIMGPAMGNVPLKPILTRANATAGSTSLAIGGYNFKAPSAASGTPSNPTPTVAALNLLVNGVAATNVKIVDAHNITATMSSPAVGPLIISIGGSGTGIGGSGGTGPVGISGSALTIYVESSSWWKLQRCDVRLTAEEDVGA